MPGLISPEQQRINDRVLGVRSADRARINSRAPISAPKPAEAAQVVPAMPEAQPQPTGFVGKLRRIFS
jgi:hypothetical protein